MYVSENIVILFVQKHGISMDNFQKHGITMVNIWKTWYFKKSILPWDMFKNIVIPEQKKLLYYCGKYEKLH